MTHTRINPKTNKPYYYKDNPEAVKARDAKRMYVNGKEVSKKHPLYRPGRYKGFTDAAFSSLKNYESSKEGQVYVLCNPAFPNWCKVGMAVDAQDRLKQFQLSSPYRDFKLLKIFNTDDRRKSEAKAHSFLEQYYLRRGEWFASCPEQAAELLENLFKGKQLELF